MNGIAAWGDFVYTCGIGDSLRQFKIESNAFTDYVVKLNCQPRGLAIFRNENIIAVACVKEITLVQDQKKAFSLPTKYEASSISVNPETLDVAVGGDDQKLHIYSLNGTTLEPTDCSYSPDNKYLVVCDAHRTVVLYSVEEYKPAHNKEGKCTCQYCGLDTQFPIGGQWFFGYHHYYLVGYQSRQDNLKPTTKSTITTYVI
ncbi:actin-interacting protein 1 [Musca domestica]|uniref:Actin-interacting protein 1 n=1 Tax=Musca domestica TaxID=7370 RepID=A0ABM3UPG3_MUSDO|nr:actin-interacting protein 1 [Musca domestica]